ncbi:uncharacterized protein PFLUO_LOCUS6536 [Penicillium psychrofluorescens]|uniref:uncharacterized protein n=1 Tax=Penicillium psychrofluorescens TaxID=3158075 RepID=UPI003CCDEB14
MKAKFNKSGILKARASRIYNFIYNFVRKDETRFKLFMCYYACDPRDGPEYKFHGDEEDTLTQASRSL